MAKVESRENLLRKIGSARISMLLIMVFTVINMVMVAMNADSYFLFSISVPYYLSALGMLMDAGTMGTYTVTGLIIGAVILAVYLLCWILSRKKAGWLTAALVLMLLDTAALVLFTFALYEDPTANLMDFIFRAWILWKLFKGSSATRKLKKLPADDPAELDLADFQGSIPELSEISDDINL